MTINIGVVELYLRNAAKAVEEQADEQIAVRAFHSAQLLMFESSIYATLAEALHAGNDDYHEATEPVVGDAS